VFARESGQWVKRGTLVAPEGQPYARFGEAVATDGQTVVVGAPDAGAAFVYIRSDTGDWSFEKTLGPGAEGSNYGAAVAVSGDLIAIGIPKEAAVQMNERVGGVWKVMRTLGAIDFEKCTNGADDDGDDLVDGDDPDCAAGAFADFGASICLQGTRLVIGAPFATATDGDTSYPGGGRTFVFTRPPPTIWHLDRELRPEAPGENRSFGWSCAFSGDRILIGTLGAIGEAGAATLFRDGESGWALERTFTADYPAEENTFGYAVALSDPSAGQVAIVTDPHFDDNTGLASVYVEDGGAWTPDPPLSNPEPGAALALGWGVAADLDSVLLGAPRYTADDIENGGAVFRFHRVECTGEGCPGADGDAGTGGPGDGDGAAADQSFYGCRAGQGAGRQAGALVGLLILLVGARSRQRRSVLSKMRSADDATKPWNSVPSARG
jgi:hypothetical protein